jgi:polysaccharide export outer membrane protein
MKAIFSMAIAKNCQERHTSTRLVSTPVLGRVFCFPIACAFWLLSTAFASASTAATMSSPTPGATLSSSSRFEWNLATPPNDFDGYALWVGTTTAGRDVAEANLPATASSVSISPLPRDGGTVYVRLWSHTRRKNWVYNDYLYTACVCSATDRAATAGTAFTKTAGRQPGITLLAATKPSPAAHPAAPEPGAQEVPETVLKGSSQPARNVAAPAAALASTAPAPVNPETYIIGPQDVLQITVWKEAEMSMPSVPVRPDGKISLPLLNDVQAAGLTTTQLSADLTSKLLKFVKDPKVTTVVTAINSKRVYVLGEVVHPGPLSMLPGMTMLQALSSVGGLSQYANAKKIYVLRTEQGAQRRIPFNYKQALKGDDLQQNIVLQPGDTIVVP